MQPFQYLAMAVLTVSAVPAALAVRRTRARDALGFIAWIALACYVPIELAVMAVAEPYDPMRQAVSILGVTSCDPEPLPEAGAVVCSPRHLLMNWTFTATGIAAAAGALLLRHRLPAGRGVTAAAWLLAAAGLGYATSGFVPADVDLLWHTVLALPGMLVQVPAWIVLAVACRRARPVMALWCAAAAAVHLVGLGGFAAALVLDLPGGLFQRFMVWALLIWAPVAALLLLRRRARPAEVLERAGGTGAAAP